MKKILLFTGLLFYSLVSFSQVKFGVFIDPRITWLSPDARGVESQGVKFGINGGLTLDNYFAKNYAFSTGLAIGTQGGKLLFDEEKVIKVYSEEETLPAGTEIDYKLQYISVPVGLKLKSNQIGYTTFFVNVGFTNQFNVKAKASTLNNGGLNDDSIKDEIKLYNLAYHFGGGVEYAIGEDTALTFGIIYHNGFLDLTDTKNTINSRVLSFQVGISF